MSAKTTVAAETGRPSLGAFFRWDVPDEAISVDLHFNVMELLERDVLRAGSGIVAGVLLGSMHRGRRLTLTIEHYEPVMREHGNQDSPLGNGEIMEPFLDRWRADQSRLSIMGLYRSCPRRQDRANVPSSNGNQNSKSYGVTPIKERAVVRGPWDVRTTDLKGLELSAQAALQGSRSSLGSEQILLLLQPRNERGIEGVLYFAQAGSGLRQSAPTLFSRAEISKSRTSESRDSDAMSDLLGEEGAASHQRPSSRARENSRRSGNWVWPLVFVVIVATLAAGLFYLRGKQVWDLLSPAPPAPVDAGLGLKLQRTGNDWQLTWNQNGPIVRSAVGGRLLITDGAIQKNLTLDLDELRQGTIVYTPVTDNAVLQLQVDTPSSAEPVRESVRIVGGLLPPLPSNELAALRSPASNGLRLSPPVISPAAPHANSEKRVASDAVPPSSAISQVTAKTAATVQPEVSHSALEKEDVKTQAADTKLTASTETQRAAINVQPTPVPEHSATVLGLTSPPVATKPAPRVAELQPAQIISSPEPMYPLEAKSLGISGPVEVEFNIDEDGGVSHVVVTKGSPALAGAAVSAVRKRHYKPATLNGVPIPIKASVVFVFDPN